MTPEPQTPAVRHSLERTSPKGEKFYGTCVLCGLEDLPLEAMRDECPNPRGVSQGDAVLDAIKGPAREPEAGGA